MIQSRHLGIVTGAKIFAELDTLKEANLRKANLAFSISLSPCLVELQGTVVTQLPHVVFSAFKKSEGQSFPDLEHGFDCNHLEK